MGMRWDSLDKIYMRIQRKTSALSDRLSVGASLEQITKGANATLSSEDIFGVQQEEICL